jgi:hypothetical protein
MKQSEPLYMDWEQSMERVHALLVAVCRLCDDLGDDMGDQELRESIWNLAELAQVIVADQLEYTRQEEAREQRAAKRKKNASRVSVGIERNPHGPDEQTME